MVIDGDIRETDNFINNQKISVLVFASTLIFN
ncbi:MAG: hypothetical protein RUMPE_00371 [Eubacteriales bacterium SKADARSKE-1]|nr:hypothetical protein [Eubacteriales bacterium SKADARSKE-1]